MTGTVGREAGGDWLRGGGRGGIVVVVCWLMVLLGHGSALWWYCRPSLLTRLGPSGRLSSSTLQWTLENERMPASQKDFHR